jgi:hypothetical protein
VTTQYLGAGFQTTGYPYQQPDRLNIRSIPGSMPGRTRSNVVANFGQRVNKCKQYSPQGQTVHGNLTGSPKFNDHWSLNVNYNNFGFQTASGTNPYGIKNVSNDLGINPTYTWMNTR